MFSLFIDMSMLSSKNKNMKILENNAGNKPPKIPLKVRCPYCDSLLIIEKEDYRKRYDWTYTSDGKRKRCYYYVVDCPCCEEEIKISNYENI